MRNSLTNHLDNKQWSDLLRLKLPMFEQMENQSKSQFINSQLVKSQFVKVNGQWSRVMTHTQITPCT